MDNNAPLVNATVRQYITRLSIISQRAKCINPPVSMQWIGTATTTSPVKDGKATSRVLAMVRIVC